MNILIFCIGLYNYFSFTFFTILHTFGRIALGITLFPNKILNKGELLFMNDFRLRMKKSVEILDMKLQEINDTKNAIGRKKVWSDTERYKLNMETLTWIINTDSLLLKNDKDYEKCKINFRKNFDKIPSVDEEQGVLLGLYFAFNVFKHNMDILSIETMKYIPMDAFKTNDNDYTIARNEWLDVVSNEDKYKYYEKYLKEKNVEIIFKSAINYLKMCISKYESKNLITS